MRDFAVDTVCLRYRSFCVIATLLMVLKGFTGVILIGPGADSIMSSEAAALEVEAIRRSPSE